MTKPKYFEYDEEMNALTMFPFKKNTKICFSSASKKGIYNLICTYLHKGEFAKKTIKALTREAKKILGLEE